MGEWAMNVYPTGSADAHTYGYLGFVTPSATPNTKGSWTTIMSAAGNRRSSSWVVVNATRSTGGWRSYLVDIAYVDAYNTRHIILPDLWFFSNSLQRCNGQYAFPIEIPAGVELQIRAQQSSDNANLHVNLFTVPKAPLTPEGFSHVVAHNVDTSLSRGNVLIDNIGTSGKGNWFELADFTGTSHRGFQVSIGHDESDLSWTDQNVWWDIARHNDGTGMLISDWVTSATLEEDLRPCVSPYFDYNFTGGKLYARAYTSGTPDSYKAAVYTVR